MKTKKLWLSLFIINVVFLTGFWGIAATNEFTESQKNDILKAQKQLDRWILKDVAGVMPTSSIYSPDAQCPLTKNELQSHIELRLRRAGIKVFSDTNGTDVNSLSNLMIRVHLQSFGPGYVVDSAIKLQEPVFLFRDPRKFLIATTWEVLPPSSGLLREVPTGKEILEIVNRSVDLFINDYLAANPKDEPTTEKPSAKRDN